MRAYLILLSAGLTALLQTANAQQPAHAVPLTVIYHSEDGNVLGDLRVLVESREEFDKYWRAVHKRDTTSPPPIDFAKESVLIVSVGTAGGSWTDIEVQSAQAQNAFLDVSVQLPTLRGLCLRSAVPRSDTEMVRVPVARLTVVFHEEVIFKDC